MREHLFKTSNAWAIRWQLVSTLLLRNETVPMEHSLRSNRSLPRNIVQQKTFFTPWGGLQLSRESSITSDIKIKQLYTLMDKVLATTFSTALSSNGSNILSFFRMHSGFNTYPQRPLRSKKAQFSCMPRSENHLIWSATSKHASYGTFLRSAKQRSQTR